jgi:uncharacterized protein YqjF (DUF2071 family)
MSFLKRIPIKYIGELHDVRLINFSVDIREVKNKVPSQIKVRDFNGRAMVSMVDVQLKNMRPEFLPKLFHFDYRHLAFRLLVEDAELNEGINKGIFFYQSFTDHNLIVAGGSMFTDYNLEQAKISDKNGLVEVKQGNHLIRYKAEDSPIAIDEKFQTLKAAIGALDRAYAFLDGQTRVTQIQREKWPIQAVNCPLFENTFFKSARLEGAFRVFETIYYTWLPPKIVGK